MKLLAPDDGAIQAQRGAQRPHICIHNQHASLQFSQPTIPIVGDQLAGERVPLEAIVASPLREARKGPSGCAGFYGLVQAAWAGVVMKLGG